MYQLGYEHENYENQVTTVMLKTVEFFNAKSVKITMARVNSANHDHFVWHDFFAKLFACNEAHKNHKIQ